jgi:hypothetical protein
MTIPAKHPLSDDDRRFVLFSPEARSRFVEPDVEPIPRHEP